MREALELESLKSATLLAGATSLDRPISTVSVIEVPDVWRWLHGNEMMLTTLYPIRDSLDSQLELVRQLAAKGISCLVVKTKRFVDSVAPEVVALAEEKALPLLELPDNVNFLDVASEVFGQVMALESDVLRESERMGRAALEMVGDRQDIHSLATLISQGVNGPVSIHDSDGRLMVLTSYDSTAMILDSLQKLDLRRLVALSETSGTLLEEATRRGYRSLSRLGSSLFARLREGSVPKDQEIAPMLVVPADSKGRRLGYLVIWDSRSVDEVTLKVIDTFALAVALSLASEKATKDVERRYTLHFIQQLISGGIDEETAVQQGSSLGMRLDKPMLVLTVIPQGSTHVSESMLRDSVLQFTGGAGVCSRGHEYVVIWPVLDGERDAGVDACTGEDQSNHLDTGRIRRILSPWYQYLVSRMGYPVRVCVGSVADKVGDIPEAYRTSQECARLLTSLGGDREALILFGDLGLMRLLALCPTQELIAFREELLGPILEYDAEKGGSLERTLFEYLSCNGNLTESARRLFIHTNSIKYRIGRIAQVLRVDLGDMSTRMNLWAALMIGRFGRDTDRD